jgi:hypothetical protein
MEEVADIALSGQEIIPQTEPHLTSTGGIAVPSMRRTKTGRYWWLTC